VLGPNGAGETTFVQTVATLVRLDGGRLRVAGIARVRPIITQHDSASNFH
jgi:ABC-type multidrug transport system ATPase subunit